MTVMKKPHYCVFNTEELRARRPHIDPQTSFSMLHMWHQCWGDKYYVLRYYQSKEAHNERNREYRDQRAVQGAELEHLDKQGQPWSERDVEYLTEYGPTTDSHQLARIFGRTVEAIEVKMRKLRKAGRM